MFNAYVKSGGDQCRDVEMDNSYTHMQIKLYGRFIDLCINISEGTETPLQYLNDYTMPKYTPQLTILVSLLHPFLAKSNQHMLFRPRAIIRTHIDN